MNNFRYANEKCPVCNEEFTDASEIVVCPLCGTPHHKDCYKKNGECGNSEKHNDGFIWTPEAKPEEQTQETQANANPYGGANANPYVGASANPYGNANANPYANANAGQQMPPYGAPVPPQAVFGAPAVLNAYPPEIEDGVSTADAAAFVKRNTHTYLRKFFALKSGRRTFNVAAFFFGGYWLIYRKMYKLAAIFIALTFAISAIPMLVPQYRQLQTELNDITAKYENAAYASSGSVEEMNEAMNNMYSDIFAAVKRHPAGIAVIAVSTLAGLALSIYLGLIADKKYKEHVIKSIKSISDAKESFGNEEFRRMRIFSEGGTAFGYVILSILALNVIDYAFSAILNVLNL